MADRELQVFKLIGEGFSTRQIAERLHVGAGTVETYRDRIKEKLRLKDARALPQGASEWNRSQGLRADKHGG